MKQKTVSTSYKGEETDQNFKFAKQKVGDILWQVIMMKCIRAWVRVVGVLYEYSWSHMRVIAASNTAFAYNGGSLV